MDDLSIFRTAYAAPERSNLRATVIEQFGFGQELLLWSWTQAQQTGFDYIPKHVANDAELTELIQGALVIGRLQSADSYGQLSSFASVREIGLAKVRASSFSARPCSTVEPRYAVRVDMKHPSRFVIALTAASSLLLVGLVGYVALGPYRTMRDFGESLAARDSEAIATAVDFPKLRESLKTQLSKSVDQKSKAVFAENPLAALAADLATNLSDTLLDSLVTPAGLEKLLAGERLFSALGNSSNGRTTLVPQAIANASYSYRSLSEFVVTLEPKPAVKVEVTLERQGLNWRMSGIKLPE